MSAFDPKRTFVPLNTHRNLGAWTASNGMMQNPSKRRIPTDDMPDAAKIQVRVSVRNVRKGSKPAK